MKNIIKDALILFAITAIAGLLLAVVNEITREPILNRQEQTKAESCQAVFENAVSFEDVTEGYMSLPVVTNYLTANPKVLISEIYLAKDGEGNKLGFCISLISKEGYGGDIQFCMGVTNDRVLNGISILSSSETVGLGLEAETVLVPQFAGKQVESFVYTKTGKVNDNEIDAISSATITTNAFVNGVNAGLEIFDLISKQEVSGLE